MTTIIPQHIQLTQEEAQNRTFILPGSSGRSEYIAKHFLDLPTLKINPSSRGHTVYLGTIRDTNIDIGVVSTGMGCPSVDIIVNELVALGVKKMVRVGTCGSLNIEKAPLGSIVIATGAVRDETTSSNYVPLNVPAIADFEWNQQLSKTAHRMKLSYSMGIVHTKDSLFAREYKLGPLANQSGDYMKVLESSGVLASEMEASHLFVLGMVHQLQTVCVLSVIGGGDDPFGLSDEKKKEVIHNSIKLVIESLKS